MRAALAALAALGLLAGCVPRATAPGPRTPPPAPGRPVVPPPPQAVAPGLFRLEGEMTQGALLIGYAPRETALLMLDGQPVRFAADGRFIIGFNRDAPPVALLEARTADGRLLRATLAIAPRQWDISKLDSITRGTSPSPVYQRIRAAESAQIAAAKSADSPSEGWRQRFAWPATGRISTLFGSQRIYRDGPGAFHGGIDVARPVGVPVLAPADGVVTLATDHPFSLEGNLVMIDHGIGLVSALMHLSKIEVKPGDRVTRGQEIGLVGRTGRVTGPHLHWGLTWKQARLDPLLVAGAMP